MIILNNNNTNVNIPDYDDLVNKPSINGVVLEGNKTAGELGIDIDTTNFYTKREVNERIADSITGIENEFGNYYTKTQSDNKYQPKGNYLTSIPSEYVTESELSGKNYATKSEIPTIPTNISSFNNDSGYITNSALSGYASETYVSDNYQPKGNYLTSIPDIYITETELNDAIAGLGGSDIPYVVITTTTPTSVSLTYTGDLNGVINAVKNQTAYNAYFYNKAMYYGLPYALYGVGFTLYDEDSKSGSFYVHSEGGGGKHIVSSLPFSFDGENYYLNNINYSIHNYATVAALDNKQDTLVSGENIKTVNGISLLGSGDIVISGSGEGGSVDLGNYYTKGEVDGLISNLDTSVAENYYTIMEVDELVQSVKPDLTGYATETWVGNHYQTKGDYATTSYVDTQIGNINTILQNILN